MQSNLPARNILGNSDMVNFSPIACRLKKVVTIFGKRQRYCKFSCRIATF